MKQSFVILALALSLHLSAQNASDSSFYIIGDYTHYINSMCEQGCEGYTLGGYELTGALSKKDNGMGYQYTAFAHGKIVEIEDYPTIAGPNADNSMSGQKVKMNRFAPTESGKADFPSVKWNAKELKKAAQGEDFTIDVTFANPLNISLDIKYRFDDQEPLQSLHLAGKEKKKMSVKMKNIGMGSLSITVYNEQWDEKDYYGSKKHAKQSGAVVYVKQYLQIPRK